MVWEKWIGKWQGKISRKWVGNNLGRWQGNDWLGSIKKTGSIGNENSKDNRLSGTRF